MGRPPLGGFGQLRTRSSRRYLSIFGSKMCFVCPAHRVFFARVAPVALQAFSSPWSCLATRSQNVAPVRFARNCRSLLASGITPRQFRFLLPCHGLISLGALHCHHHYYASSCLSLSSLASSRRGPEGFPAGSRRPPGQGPKRAQVSRRSPEGFPAGSRSPNQGPSDVGGAKVSRRSPEGFPA